MNRVFRDVCEVAIVGAGPYGLSLASHLTAAGIETRTFGDPLAFWRNNMPDGMRVRSARAATRIVDPGNRLSLDAYAAATGLQTRGPLPREDFIRYGDWFQRHAVPDLDHRKVSDIDAMDGGFLVRLDDGNALQARRVVVATGLTRQDYRPRQFVGLASDLVSHTCEHSGLARFRDCRVAVIGGGQSGCEGAALLAEAGAEVNLITRAPIHWLTAETSGNLPRSGLRRRLYKSLATCSGVGPFPLSWLNEAPGLLHRLPHLLRAKITELSLRPGAADWIRPRLAGVRIDNGRIVYGARAIGDRVILDLDNGSREFDHVMLATGYRIDIARLGFLGSDLLAAVATTDGSPILSTGCELSVRGLHFIGASAIFSFGPLLGFLSGTGHAARAVTNFMLAQPSGRDLAALDFAGAPDELPVR